MSEDVNNTPENQGEELDNVLVLNDENGNEVEFEFLDLIEYVKKTVYKKFNVMLQEEVVILGGK